MKSYHSYVKELGPSFLILSVAGAIGVATPTILQILGYGPLMIAGFMMALFALVIDGVVTKIAMNRSMSEFNVLLVFISKRIGTNYALLLSRIVGIAMILYALVVLRNAFVLFGFAWLFLTIVLVSSCSLLLVDLRVNTNEHYKGSNH